MTARTCFPRDFPELKDCRDAKVLAAAIKGAADSLTSVDLSSGGCLLRSVPPSMTHVGNVP